MGFGLGIVASIGGSLLGSIGASKAGKQSARDALENIRLNNQKLQHDRLALMKDQAFDRGLNRVSAGASGLDVSSFQDVFGSNEINDQLDLEALRFDSNLRERSFQRDRRNAQAQSSAAFIGGIADIGTSLLSLPNNPDFEPKFKRK